MHVGDSGKFFVSGEMYETPLQEIYPVSGGQLIKIGRTVRSLYSGICSRSTGMDREVQIEKTH